jgi:outer membrane receptor protein involved in Fe transport
MLKLSVVITGFERSFNFAGADVAGMLGGLMGRGAASVAPVVIRSMPFAAPIPAPLYYLDGVRVAADVGTSFPAAQISMVQVTQPGSAGARSVIRITSVKAADKALASATAQRDGAASMASAPEAALYTSIARVVAGTDAVQPVDVIYIGRVSSGVATAEAAPARFSVPAQTERSRVPPEASAQARATAERVAASGMEMMVVVDGVIQLGGNAMATLDPDTFASVEVLRGEAAARLYGSRAEAGVVVITTKR